MSKLEEKILNKIKNKKETRPKNNSSNAYGLVNLAWLFLLPPLLIGILCKLFIKNSTIISILMAFAMLCGVYNVIKAIKDAYEDKK